MVDKKEVLRLTELAYQARRDLCKLCGAYSGNIHMGGDMSMLDVLTCLFHRTMNISPEREQDPTRDRFILSKGTRRGRHVHRDGAKGVFDYQEICETYGGGQQVRTTSLQDPTADAGRLHWFTLGHGLPLSVGLAARPARRGAGTACFRLMGDGETCEGSVWEAAMAGHALGLGNLVAVVDRNRQLMTSFSEDSIKLAPYADKWRAFGWNVIEIADGNDMQQVLRRSSACRKAAAACRPRLSRTRSRARIFPLWNGRSKWHAGHERCGSADRAGRPGRGAGPAEKGL